MLNKKDGLIIILFVLLISVAGVYAYDKFTEEAYQRGISDATLLINQQILNSLQQNGYVPFIFVENNQTYNIKLIPQIQNEN